MQVSKNSLLTDQLKPGKISSTVALAQIDAGRRITGLKMQVLFDVNKIAPD